MTFPLKVVVLLVGAAACTLGWAAAPAGAVVDARPVIVAIDAKPAGGLPMRPSGASVVVTVRVRNASTCTFLSQHSPFSALYSLKTVGCASGWASITVAAIANTTTAQAQLTYAVRVRGAGGTVQQSVTLSESGAQSKSPPGTTTTTTPTTPPAPTASLTISSSSLSSTGGSIVLTYSSTNASSCSLASSPALWTGSNPASVNCSGAYTASVSTTTSQRVWTFTFTATSSSGQSASSTQTLTEQAPPNPAPTASLSLSQSTLTSAGGSVVLTYSSSNAATCSLASSPTLWTGSNPATVSCNGTYSVTITSSTAQRQWTFTFNATNSAGQSTTSTRTLTEQAPAPQPVPTPGLLQTPNWSGYVLSSSSIFTEVSGQWRVPTLNCSATPNAGAAPWVGIGGYGTSGTLLQTGIATDCVNGVQSNNGWFEEVPTNPNHSYSFTGFPVSAGDLIRASVYQWSDGTRWETCVEDLTTGLSGLMVTGEGWGVSTGGCESSFREQGSTVNLSYSGAYTAEWILEDYEQGGIGGANVPFANYGSVAFSNLTTSLVGWQLSAAQGIEIAQNGVVLSTPSSLTTAGFSVSFTGQ